MDYELIEYKGKIAVAAPWIANYTQPQWERTIWVFPQMADDYGVLSNYSIGLHIGYNVVQFQNKLSWKRISFKCDNTGIVVQEAKPYLKPGRGGKDWNWVYRDGKWEKSYEHV